MVQALVVLHLRLTSRAGADDGDRRTSHVRAYACAARLRCCATRDCARAAGYSPGHGAGAVRGTGLQQLDEQHAAESGRGHWCLMPSATRGDADWTQMDLSLQYVELVLMRDA